MKQFIMIAVFSLSSFALACPHQEGQFIGTVKNYQKVGVDQYLYDCSFEVELSYFRPSFVCPLHPGEVSAFRIEDTQCSLKEGEQISGVLVLKDGVLTIE
jgi:hypothetical protein